MYGLLHLLWLVVSFNGNPVTLYQTPSADYTMRQGWYNCENVSFVPFAASNPLLAKQLSDFAYQRHRFCYPNNPTSVPSNGVGGVIGVDYSPALDCALENEDLIGDVYMINCGQCIVFSTQPGNDDYTPLWEVHYLEWAPNLTKTCLCSEQEVLDAVALGDLIEIIPPSVLNATIIIPTSKIPSVTLAELDYAHDRVQFYAYPVFYGERFRIARDVRFVLVTDSSDLDIAQRLGANYSANLATAAPDCCGDIEAFVDPIPPFQLPIITEVPDYSRNQVVWSYSTAQTNADYNPLLCWQLLDRGSLPPYAIIDNEYYKNLLLGLGVISEIPNGTIVTNSPVTEVFTRKTVSSQ